MLLCTGLRPQLIARLAKVLKSEENDATVNEEDGENEATTVDDSLISNDDGDIDMSQIMLVDEYDSTKPDAKKLKDVSSFSVFFLFC